MAQRGRPRSPGLLTPREQEVLDLIRAGRTNADIGEALGITVETVKQHVSQVLDKLGVESREEAAVWREERQAWWAALPRWALVGAAGAVLVALGVLMWGLSQASDGDSATEVTRSPTSSVDRGATPKEAPTPHFTSITTPPFAAWPDCETIVAADLPDTLTVLDAETCEVKSISGAANASRLTWSPDGRAIAYLSADDYFTLWPATDVYVAYIASGQVHRVTNSPSLSKGIPIWSPGGTRVLYSTFDRGLLSDTSEESWTQNVEISDITNGTTTVVASGLKCVGHYSWLGGGSSIAVASGCRDTYHIDIYDLDTGEASILRNAMDVPLTQPGGDLTTFPCTPPASSSVTICVADGLGREATMIEASSFLDEPSGAGPIEGGSPMWSSDGKAIGFSGSHSYYYVFRVQERLGRAVDLSGTNHNPIFLTSRVLSSVECDPDGATPCSPFTLRSRQLDSGESRDVLVLNCGTGGFEWSPDGTQLAITNTQVTPCF